MVITRQNTNRLIFFDNLRYLMVLLVLVFHSAASYSSVVSFWPFHEASTTEFLDILMILLDVFMMPVLFFISGYFALSSIQKAGGRDFIKDKLLRLGLPWLVLTVFVLPLLDYIHYYAQVSEGGEAVNSFATHWLLSMRTFTSFSIGPMDMSRYFTMPEQFYQRYLWFLSLLLLFMLVFAFGYMLKTKRGKSIANLKTSTKLAVSKKSIYFTLVVVGAVTVLLYIPIYLFFSPDMGWFSIGNVIQFQPTKLIFYVCYFGMGLYAYSRRWFSGGVDFGRPLLWIIIWFLLTIANLLLGRSMFRTDEPSIGSMLSFAVIYPVWTLSFLGVFVSFACRRWNQPGIINNTLGSNSYNMYLVHYVFPMTLPLALSSWVSGNIFLKYGVTALATILLSYLLSRYILRNHSRLTVLAVIVLFVMAVLILQ